MEILDTSKIYIDYMSSDRIPFPRSLQIEITSYCNLKCKMCPKTLQAFRSEPNRMMDKEVLDYIITSILPYVYRIDLVGDGEPLLAPDLLFELLENANIFKVPATICTNGILLDTEMAKKLVEFNVEDINISIDAARPETYSQIRGGDFDQLLYNIRNLNQIKKDADKLFPRLHFSMVAMRENIEELPELMHLAKTMNSESLTIQAMGEESDEIIGQSAFLHHRDLAEEILYKCLIEAEADSFPLKVWPTQLLDVMAGDDDLTQFLSGQIPPPGDPSEWRKNCLYLWNSPFITTAGDVRPCCANLPVMGNLKVDSFHDIWYGSKFSDLRRNMLLGDLPPQCLKCPGMSWRKVLIPKHYLNAQDEIANYFPGWFDAELEERNYRWVSDKAALFLRAEESSRFLMIQMRKSTLPNAPESGSISINNEKPVSFQIRSTNWETHEFPLQKVPENPLIKVELSFSHSVRASEIEKNSHDCRDISVKIARVWTEAWPKKVVFGRQIILLGYEVVPENWVLGGEVIFRTFWRTLDKIQPNLKVFVHFTREGNSQFTSSSIGRKLGFGKKDFFQADHLLLLNGTPSSMWDQGIFVADEHFFSIPDDLHEGHYRVEIGLYPEGSTKDRIDISRSDREYSKDRALLGTIHVSNK